VRAELDENVAGRLTRGRDEGNFFAVQGECSLYVLEKAQINSGRTQQTLLPVGARTSLGSLSVVPHRQLECRRWPRSKSEAFIPHGRQRSHDHLALLGSTTHRHSRKAVDSTPPSFPQAHGRHHCKVDGGSDGRDVVVVVVVEEEEVRQASSHASDLVVINNLTFSQPFKPASHL
jgi:hypothetical protein